MAPPPDASAVVEGALYVYGIVPGDVAPSLDDAPAVEAGAGVRLLDAGGLRVLVTPVSDGAFAGAASRAAEDLAWLEAPVRAHEAVLERALAVGPVIPMRFGTVVSDDAALRRYVDERRAGFLATLRELDGAREWGVKVLSDEAALRERELAGDDAPAGSRSEGAAYLARKRAEREVAARVSRFAGDAARDVHAALSAVADRAATLGQTVAPRDDAARVLLNGAYLVRVDAEERFRAALADLAARYGDSLELAVTGPWPPYSFVAAGDDG